MSLSSAVMLGMSAGAAIGQVSAPDLVFDHLEVTSLEFVDSRFEIGISYEILNIGGMLIDLSGPNPLDQLDNIAIQTYLTSNPDLSEPVFASGGSVIVDPVVLNPGESFSGVFYANTEQFIDPSVLDPNTWVVIDIVTSSVPMELDHNNRGFVQIPSPGSASLLAAAGFVSMGRRRR